MAVVCGRCLAPRATRGIWWQERWFCGAMCSHAAGDRTACVGWACGCTAYAKKRRLLRAHREEMRIAQDLLIERGLEAEFESRLIAETGNTGFCLAYSEVLDEASDVEDPEAALRDEVAGLRAEASDRTSMVQAVAGALRCARSSRVRSRSPRQSQPRSD